MTASRFGSVLVQLVAAAVFCFGGVAVAKAGEVELPVPRVTIYPGQVIQQAMLVDRAFRTKDDKPVSAIAASEALVGKVSKQTLLPGSPIYSEQLREPHAVIQGQAAHIVFRSGALTITGSAIALQSGGAGDVVSLRNADSGRIIKGTVAADGSVNVSDQ